MRKILSIAVLFVVIVTTNTGCLKDKGFDEHVYGINSPETSPAGVGLPLASDVQTFGLNLSPNPQVVEDLLVANLLAGKPAASDIKVNLVLKPSLIADYNTANTASVIALPNSFYTLPTSTITIKAGETLGKIVINVPKTIGLDANTTYGLGFSIASTDAGYTIASNLRDLLILFNIKNQWDGRYQLKNNFVHPTQPSFGGPVTINDNIELRTSSPTSVALYWGAAGVQDYVQPWRNGSSLTWYADWGPNFTVATGNAVTVTSFQTSPSQVLFNTASYNSRYEPATKTFYVQFAYNTAAPRVFTDTLKYLGPR